VRLVVAQVERRWPELELITYRAHPWPGWDGQSFDVWDESSTWDNAPYRRLESVRLFLMDKVGEPYIRHTILGHRLWTSFGGYSEWASSDHSGRRRHLHVTYW
jgi:hypothetical protein